MQAVCLMACFCVLPAESATVDRCDITELNHVYTECAKHQFSQLIFWQRVGDHYEVRSWRLLKGDNMRPVKDWGGRGWVTRWMDGDRLREVWSATFRESWQQADAEMVERAELPQERRRKLLFEGQ